MRAVRPALFSTSVVLFAVVSLFPVAWVFRSKAAGRVLSPRELFAPPPEVFPGGFSLLPYLSVLYDPGFLRALANGVIGAVTTTVVCLLIGSMAAYAIARSGFRPGGTCLALALALGLLPPLAAVAPPVARSAVMEVLDNRMAMIVPDLVFALPLAIWFLIAYFRELPAELGDAARSDGPAVGTFWRIVVPVVTPGVLTTAVLTFVFAWNRYLFARTPAFEERLKPVTALLPGIPADLLPVLSVVVTLPLVALVLGYQRLAVAGLDRRRTGGVEVPASGERPKARKRRVAPGVAMAVLLLAQGWAALLFLRHGWDALAFPFPLNYGEGPLLDQAVRLAGFENVYRPDLGRPPYTISNYPPFYLAVQAPFVWLFGPEFWYGRLISLLSVAATALFVALTLFTLTRDRIAAMAAGLTFPAIPYVLRWSSLARVDLLGLALSWAGLLVVVRWSGRRRAIVAASLLFVAAVLTRQTYVLAAPLTAFVWLVVQGQRRRALELAGISCGLGLASFAALNLATDGGFFLNTVTANINEFRWERVSFNAISLLACPLLLLGGLAFFGLAPRDRTWWLVCPYLALSLPSALLVGKVGSDVNYLLELSAALCLVTGALLAWQRERPRLRALLLSLLAVQVLALAQSSLVPSGLQDYVVEQEREVRQLSRIVAEADGPVLTDEYMGLLPLHGRRIKLQPFEMTQLSRDGSWEQGRAVRSIRDQRYAVIMVWQPPFARDIKRDRWTDEMLAAVDARYERTDRVADMVVYRPE